MTVYVDRLTTHRVVRGEARRYGTHWCHLWSDADGEAELHVFARRIVLLLKWFQPHRRLNHYDLARSRRERALIAGAVEVDIREYLRRRRDDAHDEAG